MGGLVESWEVDPGERFFLLSNFQFSSLLAPMGIKKAMAKFIHKFLWQGGKDNEKKFHMENWNIVCAPREHGGLRVLDPERVNISLGEKLLWILVIGSKEWWKKEICP
jgi:hypothetical protein